MKKIAFLGASVTAQKFAHQSGELTGYVEAFREHHATNLGFSEVLTHAWPGNRLGDAGFVCIHQMLAEKPDVAVIEPMVEDRSRGLDFNERHIHFFFQSCINAGVLPIALALPKPRGVDPFGHHDYEILKNYCDSRKLSVIPVVLPPGMDKETFYRDMVHTNRAGAEFYAQAFADALPGILARGWGDIDVVSREPVYEITEIPSRATGDFQSICIRNLKPEASKGPILILQKQKIGIFSPIITVTIEWLSGGFSTYDQSIWDPYCHYERLSYVKIAEADRGDFAKIRVSVSDDSPKYETCRGDFDFTECKHHRFMRPVGSFWLISDQTFDLSIEVA
jgi:hypothetical protein